MFVRRGSIVVDRGVVEISSVHKNDAEEMAKFMGEDRFESELVE